MRAPLTCCIGLLSNLITCHIKNRYNNTSTYSVFPQFYEQWVYSLTLVKIKTQALVCCWYGRIRAEVSVPADPGSAAGDGLSPLPVPGAARWGCRGSRTAGPGLPGGPAPPARRCAGGGPCAGNRRRSRAGGGSLLPFPSCAPPEPGRSAERGRGGPERTRRGAALSAGRGAARLRSCNDPSPQPRCCCQNQECKHIYRLVYMMGFSGLRGGLFCFLNRALALCGQVTEQIRISAMKLAASKV